MFNSYYGTQGTLHPPGEEGGGEEKDTPESEPLDFPSVKKRKNKEKGADGRCRESFKPT